MPSAADIEHQLASRSKPSRVAFDTTGMSGWDSSILPFLVRIYELCRQNGVNADLSGLPPGLRRLVELAEAIPERKDARAAGGPRSLVERLGDAAIGWTRGVEDFAAFIGELTVAVGRLTRNRARFRRVDFYLLLQECGVGALGIVTLISYLVGVILAFMGAVQLQQFGASIYVADLVGIAMAREMGAMMTGIIMAGRTGAAFAAQIGTMKVTQEIDALETTGLSPMEFLVLPRLLALVLMMPLLCLYSDFLGVLGGATVGRFMLHLSVVTYLSETAHAVTLHQIYGGLFKSIIYGIVVAIAGCLRGFQCGNSSSAVGDAATQAVVTSIIYIVVSCGILAVIYNIIGM